MTVFRKISLIYAVSFVISLLASVSLAVEGTPLEHIDFAAGLFSRGMYGMAKEEYAKFLKLFPENEFVKEAYFGLAESAYFLKEYDEAIDAYQSYIDGFPQGDKALGF